MKKPFKPIVGRWCRQRDGDIVGPVKRSVNEKFPFQAGEFLFSENGRFSLAKEMPFDLVANLQSPRIRKKKMKMMTGWMYSYSWTLGPHNFIFTSLTKSDARRARNTEISLGRSVGPIVKIQIPAPVGGRVKK